MAAAAKRTELAPAPAPDHPLTQFKREIELRRPTIEKMLPAHIRPEPFFAGLALIASKQPKLLECERGTLIRAAYEAAELGFSLNPAMKECDILPAFNKRAGMLEAQLRPRYMGLLKLARQSGQVHRPNAHVVYENDVFEIELGGGKSLLHRPAKGDRGKAVGAYCIWWLSTDRNDYDFDYMTEDVIERARQFSQAPNSDAWTKHRDEMWRKTVVRRASKYMPMSTETDSFRKAVALDEAREIGQQVEIKDGDVWAIDVTAEAEPPKSTKSMEKLKAKLVPASLPEDIDAWVVKIESEAKSFATTDDVLAYANTLEPQLAALDLVRPELAAEVRTMLDRAAEGVVE